MQRQRGWKQEHLVTAAPGGGSEGWELVEVRLEGNQGQLMKGPVRSHGLCPEQWDTPAGLLNREVIWSDLHPGKIILIVVWKMDLQVKRVKRNGGDAVVNLAPAPLHLSLGI